MRSVTKDIYFYRIDTGRDNGGQLLPFDPAPTLEFINGLPWDSSGRYWPDGDRIVACWVDQVTPPAKIMLGSIRRDDLPQVELGGELTALEVEPNAGLVEQTHIVFLTPTIAGCVFNFYGPRVTKLPFYFSEKAFRISPKQLHFRPLLRQDVYRQLQRLQHLRLFDLRMRAPYIDTVKAINRNLWRTLRAAVETGQGDEVEVILRVSKQQAGWLDAHLLRAARRMSRRPDLRYEVGKFAVTGYDVKAAKSVALDLLSDKLIAKRSIVRIDARSKGLNKNDAYRAIISAYDEVATEIEAAATVEV